MQGDLEELCEPSLGGNMGQEDVSGFLGLPSTSTSGELLTPGEGSAHTPASVESASRTLTETTGLEAGLDRMEEAEQAEQQSNNKHTGSCGGQCSNNKEGEENMNIQGYDGVFLSNSRFVTTRDEEIMPGSRDDVFLAGEESQSFKQQVFQVTTEGGRYIHPLAGHLRPPLPRASDSYLTRGAGEQQPRSSSMPAAVKRKNSLVELMRDQRKERMLFPSNFETDVMPGKRCPPEFPQEKRRGSKSEVSDIDGRS